MTSQKPESLYPSLFKRPANRNMETERARGARHAGHYAAQVIANAREHLGRARSHLNLPPLGPVVLGPELPLWSAERSGVPAPSLESNRRRRQLQTLLDDEVRSLAGKLGRGALIERGSEPLEADETSACMARVLKFLQSGALRDPDAAEVNDGMQNAAAELASERELRKNAEDRAASATQAADEAAAKIADVIHERDLLASQLAEERALASTTEASATADPTETNGQVPAVAAQKAASEARAAERAAAQSRETEQVCVHTALCAVQHSCLYCVWSVGCQDCAIGSSSGVGESEAPRGRNCCRETRNRAG